MKPQDIYRNGDGGAGAGAGLGACVAGGVGVGGQAHDDDSEGEEACAAEEELSLQDAGAPARALAALNALRKSRQHYDVLLLAAGAEVPAHRAVLAAASPYLLEALGAGVGAGVGVGGGSGGSGGAAPAYRVEGVEAEALRELVEYVYTGRLRVGSAAAARSLYRAAWRLRLDAPRHHLAAALLRKLTPPDCLDVRALPDLAPQHVAELDAYIAENFDEVCASGALGALPLIRIEMLRESGAGAGGVCREPHEVADAALAWLRSRSGEADLREVCARTHLLYVDAAGALRDCGELPAARGDAPELQEYRREAAERGRAARRARAAPAPPPTPLPGLELGARHSRDGCAVLAARCGAGGGGGGGATRALLAVRGELAAARVAWRAGGAGAGPARGPGPGAGVERAPMGTARCALGAAELGGRLVVCGGYDRARVLRSAERYCARDNAWAPLAELRGPRARFPAARLGDALYLLGGSDGHAELDSVEVLVETGAGARWEARARLPLARSHAGAAGVPARGELYAVGGWAAGLPLRRVHRYSPLHDKWTEAPPLGTGRSQCAVVWYSGALWALGGCDAWHCLASTELLRLDCEPEPEPAVEVEAGAEGEVEASPGWQAGPALPTARRSVGAAAWRGDLVVAGGSDGGASLRRTDWLNGDTWRTGPSLRRARAGLGLAVVGEALFAVGGFDGKEFLACVECLYQPAGEWTALCADRAPLPALPSAPSAPSTPSADPAPADAPSAPADETEQKKPEPEPAPGGQ